MVVAVLRVASALAAPTTGAGVPYVVVEDTKGKAHKLPDAQVPVLVIYEDQDAGAQNVRAKELVGAYNRLAENHTKLEVWPVADLQKWNWWPAKKYVFAKIREIAKKENTAIFLDWAGVVRGAWGLTKGKSAYVLVAVDGRVLFAGEGTLSEAQLRELDGQLRALGLTHD
jgi:hypothetical protein